MIRLPSRCLRWRRLPSRLLLAALALVGCAQRPAPLPVAPPAIAPLPPRPAVMAAPAVEHGGRAVAFVGVTLLPMDRPRAIADQTVLVEGDRIRAVGPSAAVAIPDDALRIDGSGRTLMPGLVDAHAHLDTAAALKLSIAAGVTTVRNMWGTPLHLLWRRRIAAGELVGPTIYTCGPIVDGSPPMWPGATVVETATEAMRAARDQKRAGYDCLKVYNNLSPPAYDHLVAAARAVGLPLVGHVPTRVGLAHVLASQQASIEHLTGYLVALQGDHSPFRGTTLLPHRRHLALHVDTRKIAALARATRAAGVWNVVTLTVDQWFLPARELAALAARPEVRLVPPWMRASWGPLDPARDARPEEYADNRRAEQVLMELTRGLRDAGARLALGTDPPNPFVVPGFSVERELVNLVQAGLTPFEALRAATADAAELLGGAGEFGAIAVGMRADLLLLEGDPLVDVANVGRRTGVMVRGRWLPARVLDAMLDELVASYAPPADRFAGMPPLAPASSSAPAPAAGDHRLAAPDRAFGRFRVEIARAPLGAERAALVTLPDGRQVIEAQAVTDEPDPSHTALRLEPGPRGRGLALSIEQERREGRTSLQLVRAHGRLRVDGSTPFAAEVHRGEPLADDALLLPPTIAAELLLAPHLRRMAVGEVRSFKLKRVALDPDLSLVDATWVVRRVPLAPASHGARAPDAAFTVEAIVQRAVRTLRLELAADGTPVLVGEPTRQGVVERRREEDATAPPIRTATVDTAPAEAKAAPPR